VAGQNGAIDLDGRTAFVEVPTFRVITGLSISMWILPKHTRMTQTLISKQCEQLLTVFALRLSATSEACNGLSEVCLSAQFGRTSVPLAFPIDAMRSLAPNADAASSVSRFAGRMVHVGLTIDILQRYTPSFGDGGMPSLDSLLAGRGCDSAAWKRVHNGSTEAFATGFDVLVVQTLLNGRLHSCIVLPYPGWVSSRFATRLSNGLPWLFGAQLNRFSLLPQAAFEGTLDEIYVLAGAATISTMSELKSGMAVSLMRYTNVLQFAR